METKEAADQILEDKEHHVIKGKWVDCKSAVLRQEIHGTSKKGSKNSSNNQSSKMSKPSPMGHMLHSPALGPQNSMGIDSGSGTSSHKQQSLGLKNPSGPFSPDSRYIDTPVLSYSSLNNRVIKTGNSDLSNYYGGQPSAKPYQHSAYDNRGYHHPQANPREGGHHIYQQPHRGNHGNSRRGYHYGDYPYENHQEQYHHEGFEYQDSQAKQEFVPAAYHEQTRGYYYEQEPPEDGSDYYQDSQHFQPTRGYGFGQHSRKQQQRNYDRPDDSNIRQANQPVLPLAEIDHGHQGPSNPWGQISTTKSHEQAKDSHQAFLSTETDQQHNLSSFDHIGHGTVVNTDRLTQTNSLLFDEAKDLTDHDSDPANPKWGSLTLEENFALDYEKTPNLSGLMFVDGNNTLQHIGKLVHTHGSVIKGELIEFPPSPPDKKSSPPIGKRSVISITPPIPPIGAQNSLQEGIEDPNGNQDQFQEQHSIGFLMGRPYDAEADMRSPNYSIYDRYHAQGKDQLQHHGMYLGSSAPHIMHTGMYSPVQQIGFLTPQDKTIIHTPSSLFSNPAKPKYNTPKTETEVRKKLLEDEARKKKSGETSGFSKYYQKVVSKIVHPQPPEEARASSQSEEQHIPQELEK